MTMSYQWIILQTGSLPLRPNGRRQSCHHACTSVLVWPEGQTPTADNAVLTDPCFTLSGHHGAAFVLRQLGTSFAELAQVFETHQHGDHMLYLPPPESPLHFRAFRPGTLDGLRLVPCPGHSEDMTALDFTSAGRAVWVVGDAVLDEEWLRAWGYYWPNAYDAAEVVQTWRSVARIVAAADTIVPGHGPPFDVTPALARELLAAFPRAEFAASCPDVAETLRRRAA